MSAFAQRLLVTVHASTRKDALSALPHWYVFFGCVRACEIVKAYFDVLFQKSYHCRFCMYFLFIYCISFGLRFSLSNAHSGASILLPRFVDQLVPLVPLLLLLQVHIQIKMARNTHRGIVLAAAERLLCVRRTHHLDAACRCVHSPDTHEYLKLKHALPLLQLIHYLR